MTSFFINVLRTYVSPKSAIVMGNDIGTQFCVIYFDNDQSAIEGNYIKMVFKSMGYYDTKARSIIVKMRAVLAHNLRLE